MERRVYKVSAPLNCSGWRVTGGHPAPLIRMADRELETASCYKREDPDIPASKQQTVKASLCNND